MKAQQSCTSLGTVMLMTLAVLAGRTCLLAAPPATQAATAAAPAPPEVTSRTQVGDVVVVKLDNGLTVIIKPMRTSPLVCVRSFVHTGSIYEGPWLGSGISHLLEHLVARSEGERADPNAPAGQAVSREGRADIGGQSNAATGLSTTDYYICADRSKATDCIDLVAAWMARPKITKADFERVRGVILREMELGNDDADHQLDDAHDADVFRGHPAAVPVIGFPAPLATLTFEDVLKYHSLMYVPQNMVFVVVGDLDVEAVLDRTRKAFAGFKAGLQPQHNLPAVKPMTGVIRTQIACAELKETMQAMSFRSVDLSHDRVYALDLLAEILASGANSWLRTEVGRRKQLTTSISAYSHTPEWGNGVFGISFRCQPDKADEAEKAVLAVLALLADSSRRADANTIETAKRKIVARFAYGQQSVQSVSEQLGLDYLFTGDVNFSESYAKRIESVDSTDIWVAAMKCFTPDRMVVTRMVPASTLPASAPASGQAAADKTVILKLPNGLRVVLASSKAVKLVSMAFVAKGGLMVEDASNNGLGDMMVSLSTSGAGDMSGYEITEFFDNAGGRIDEHCDTSKFSWEASVLSGSFDKAISVFADVVQKPTFSPKELENRRRQQLVAIDTIDEDWDKQLFGFYCAKLFKGTPLSLRLHGSKEVVSKATVEQIREHHRKYVRAGNSVLAIFGNFDADAAAERVKELFADMPGGKVNIKIPPAPTVPQAGETHVLKTERNIAAVLVAVPGMTLDNPDRFAMNVLDTIISGYTMPGGWLHTELRAKQLVYFVHASNWCTLAPGAFRAYAACEPDKAAEILSIITKNLRKAADYTPTEAEVKRAVNIILTADALDTQSMSSQAITAATDELYGFGHDFRNKIRGIYAKITPADVAAVGKKYLCGGYFTVVTTPAPQFVEQVREKP